MKLFLIIKDAENEFTAEFDITREDLDATDVWMRIFKPAWAVIRDTVQAAEKADESR